MSKYSEWKRIYREYPVTSLPWELGRPREVLGDLIKSGLIKGKHALDLCCGAGTNSIYIAKRGFSIVAMDIAPDAIAYAREKAEKTGAEIDFIIGSFVELPFADETFDFIFDLGCFHHVLIEDRNQFIDDINRILKIGGLYQLTCFSYKNGTSWNHFTKKDIRDLFSWGFDIKDVKHYGSVENDGVRRYFFTFLMKKL